MTNLAEFLWLQILRFPAAASSIGNLLGSAGLGALMVAWQVHNLLAVLDGQLGRVGAQAPQSLQQLYPQLWTWWVPESRWGVCACVAALIAGAAMSWAAKIARRYQ
jgi:hypothetical protein